MKNCGLRIATIIYKSAIRNSFDQDIARLDVRAVAERRGRGFINQQWGFSADYLLRFIKLATKPAPKPLSIFTTVTFEAHELSMPSNAASPSNEAP